MRNFSAVEAERKPGDGRHAGWRPYAAAWHFILAKFIFPNKMLRELRIADPSGRAVDCPAASP